MVFKLLTHDSPETMASTSYYPYARIVSIKRFHMERVDKIAKKLLHTCLTLSRVKLQSDLIMSNFAVDDMLS